MSEHTGVNKERRTATRLRPRKRVGYVAASAAAVGVRINDRNGSGRAERIERDGAAARASDDGVVVVDDHPTTIQRLGQQELMPLLSRGNDLRFRVQRARGNSEDARSMERPGMSNVWRVVGGHLTQDESLPHSKRRDADLVFAQYHEPLPDACNAVRWTQGAPTCGLCPGGFSEADGPLLIASLALVRCGWHPGRWSRSWNDNRSVGVLSQQRGACFSAVVAAVMLRIDC
ncbi:hypothetical protein M409DRAFT_59592 [Zasmidium cellare ATCC 36951]|uniref:Uncharacterized protein n=1 Tax=Zasmidium cellare ATCC 36951 TaxID=1080233 RepID=A0A6A6C169_ZASCE|nr:uncharacterized protein M409DRAFT_59592 [Zasmidium cellare ATCC 36951]KAF2160797.1 hypothetical protein M409DRAFT_59592 [Zasmidium cellare ATCC 36951]